MSPTLIMLFVFFTVVLGTLAVYLVVRDLSLAGGEGGSQSAATLRRMSLARDERQPTSLLESFDHWFYRVLVESGLDWSPLTALLVLVLVGCLCGGTIFVVYEALLPATFAALLGVVFTIMMLALVRSRRMRLLQDQLPVALDLLSRAVHAGESLEQGVRLVGERSPEPLATEFRRCASQLEMGLSVPATMRALVHRVPLLDMRIFSTTLSVHRRAGGNLAQTLERLAMVIRDRLGARRQLRATLAAGRMSATFMLILGPCVFAYMFLLQRDYISGLLESTLGQTLLIVAVILELIGMIWVTRMLRAAER